MRRVVGLGLPMRAAGPRPPGAPDELGPGGFVRRRPPGGPLPGVARAPADRVRQLATDRPEPVATGRATARGCGTRACRRRSRGVVHVELTEPGAPARRSRGAGAVAAADRPVLLQQHPGPAGDRGTAPPGCAGAAGPERDGRRGRGGSRADVPPGGLVSRRAGPRCKSCCGPWPTPPATRRSTSCCRTRSAWAGRPRRPRRLRARTAGAEPDATASLRPLPRRGGVRGAGPPARPDGPRVCRRTLGNPHAAYDAFHSTFLCWPGRSAPPPGCRPSRATRTRSLTSAAFAGRPHGSRRCRRRTSATLGPGFLPRPRRNLQPRGRRGRGR